MPLRLIGLCLLNHLRPNTTNNCKCQKRADENAYKNACGFHSIRCLKLNFGCVPVTIFVIVTHCKHYNCSDNHCLSFFIELQSGLFHYHISCEFQIGKFAICNFHLAACRLCFVFKVVHGI